MSTSITREQVQRLIFRCSSEAMIDAVARLSRRFDGDFIKGLVFIAVAQDGPSGNASYPGASIRGIAGSLDMPPETIRRRMHSLLSSDLVERTAANGFRIAAKAMTSVAEHERCNETISALNVVLRRLAALGYGPGEILIPDDASALVTETTRAFDAFILRASRCGPVVHGDLTNSVIFVALLYLNAAPVTYDFELAWRYAGRDDPPPDGLLRAVKATEVARIIAMAPLTVRRRLASMEALGRCERAKGGYVASRPFLEAAPTLNSGLLISQYFDQMLDGLIRRPPRCLSSSVR